MDDTALLALAAELARRAGAVILQIRARGFEALEKADSTPVTEADHAAEALILAGLRAATPDIPVVAEEEIAGGHQPGRADTFWLVDPLDGTREFAAGRDDFTVNIGLVRDGVCVLGAVGLPAHGELFGGLLAPSLPERGLHESGSHGGGPGKGGASAGTAWKRDGSGERPIAVRAVPAAGLAVLASRHYADDPRLGQLLEGRRVASIGNIGSAVKFVRVAEGAADLYPRFGRTMEWDTAAPQAVLEAAGGFVRTTDGAPLRYGKPGWENPPFVCTGLS